MTEVVSLLQELVTAQVFEGDDLGALTGSAGATQQTRREFGPTTAPTSAPLARPSSSEEGEEEIPSLTLAADAGTNTLLAVGEPRLLGQVAGLIQQLDVRQPQVMVEVTSIERLRRVGGSCS